MDKNKMAKIDNVWQMSWLKEDGIDWVTYEVINRRVVFYYDMSQDEMNLKISQYCKSRDYNISNHVEAIRTIIKSAINCNK